MTPGFPQAASNVRAFWGNATVYPCLRTPIRAARTGVRAARVKGTGAMPRRGVTGRRPVEGVADKTKSQAGAPLFGLGAQEEASPLKYAKEKPGPERERERNGGCACPIFYFVFFNADNLMK